MNQQMQQQINQLMPHFQRSPQQDQGRKDDADSDTD
jgi:hypothetical protein